MGGTGLEPVTPSLSRWCSRAPPSASVHVRRFVKPTQLSERTLERTGTNTQPCHSCHARSRLPARRRGGQNPPAPPNAPANAERDSVDEGSAKDDRLRDGAPRRVRHAPRRKWRHGLFL